MSLDHFNFSRKVPVISGDSRGLGQDNITVTCLAPGWLKAAQTKVQHNSQEWLDYLIDRISLKRVGQPYDLDGTVMYLASDASARMTGQIVQVDGASAPAQAKQPSRTYPER